MRISVITINFNETDATIALLESLPSAPDIEVIVIDNASEEDPTSRIEELFPYVLVKRLNSNLGFAGGNNAGIKMATGEYIFFLNNDAVADDTIYCLANYLDDHPQTGAVSPKIQFYNTDQIQFAGYTPVNPFTGRNLTIGLGEKDMNQFNQSTPTAYLHGAAMMVRKSVIEVCGPMPEIYFLYYEELDWSETIKRNGFQIDYVPCCTILHKDSMSTGKLSALKTYYMTRNRILFMRRNQSFFPYLIFIAYFISVGIPASVFRLIVKGKIECVPSVIRGLFWNITHSSK